jgi:hypothetical protein
MSLLSRGWQQGRASQRVLLLLMLVVQFLAQTSRWFMVSPIDFARQDTTIIAMVDGEAWQFQAINKSFENPVPLSHIGQNIDRITNCINPPNAICSIACSTSVSSTHSLLFHN